MKKIIAIMSIFGLILVGCGKDDSKVTIEMFEEYLAGI